MEIFDELDLYKYSKDGEVQFLDLMYTGASNYAYFSTNKGYYRALIREDEKGEYFMYNNIKYRPEDFN